MSSHNSNSSWLTASTNTLAPVPSARANTALEAFPRGEHASLKTAVKTKTVLRIIFHYLKVDMKTVPAHEKEATEIQRINVRSYKIPHTKEKKQAERSLELKWEALIPVCYQHVLQLRHELKDLSPMDRKLFLASEEEPSGLGIQPGAANSRRLYGIVNALIGDNPLSPGGGQEDTAILAYMASQIPAGDPDVVLKTANMLLEITRTLKRVRDEVNHTLIWALGVLCHPSVVDALKQIQTKHILANTILAAAGNPTLPLTAQPMYNYIKDNCTVENKVLVEQLKSDIKRMYRKVGVTLYEWYKQFTPYLDELVSNGVALTSLQWSRVDQRRSSRALEADVR